MNPVAGAAALAGRGTGYAVRFLRLVRFGGKGEKAPEVLEDILRNAILAEVKRTGIQLAGEEIKGLVERVIELLEKVFNGEISIDAIPSVSDTLGAGGVLSGFLAPLIRGGSDFSEKKREMLEGILEENILLRQAK